jgi:hypothetical protein
MPLPFVVAPASQSAVGTRIAGDSLGWSVALVEVGDAAIALASSTVGEQHGWRAARLASSTLVNNR